jgi:hypothetical protein
VLLLRRSAFRKELKCSICYNFAYDPMNCYNEMIGIHRDYEYSVGKNIQHNLKEKSREDGTSRTYRAPAAGTLLQIID